MPSTLLSVQRMQQMSQDAAASSTNPDPVVFAQHEDGRWMFSKGHTGRWFSFGSDADDASMSSRVSEALEMPEGGVPSWHGRTEDTKPLRLEDISPDPLAAAEMQFKGATQQDAERTLRESPEAHASTLVAEMPQVLLVARYSSGICGFISILPTANPQVRIMQYRSELENELSADARERITSIATGTNSVVPPTPAIDQWESTQVWTEDGIQMFRRLLQESALDIIDRDDYMAVEAIQQVLVIRPPNDRWHFRVIQEVEITPQDGTQRSAQFHPPHHQQWQQFTEDDALESYLDIVLAAFAMSAEAHLSNLKGAQQPEIDGQLPEMTTLRVRISHESAEALDEMAAAADGNTEVEREHILSLAEQMAGIFAEANLPKAKRLAERIAECTTASLAPHFGINCDSTVQLQEFTAQAVDRLRGLVNLYTAGWAVERIKVAGLPNGDPIPADLAADMSKLLRQAGKHCGDMFPGTGRASVSKLAGRLRPSKRVAKPAIMMHHMRDCAEDAKTAIAAALAINYSNT